MNNKLLDLDLWQKKNRNLVLEACLARSFLNEDVYLARTYELIELIPRLLNMIDEQHAELIDRT